MRKRAKVDDNQREVVLALKRVGATVQSIAVIGAGCPDLVCGIRGQNYLLEIKGECGVLTPDETRWHSVWRGQIAVVHNVDEALRAIGL